MSKTAEDFKLRIKSVSLWKFQSKTTCSSFKRSQKSTKSTISMNSLKRRSFNKRQIYFRNQSLKIAMKL